jgi:hypothetical protein
MWFFSRKPKTIRNTIDGATVMALLDLSLRGRKRSDYRHISQKEIFSVITRADVDRASRKAFMPWKADAWECENIAMACLNEAQKMAANEGRSWAMGILRARAQRGISLHVYVWAIVLNEGRFADRDVYFYDPTAQSWVAKEELRDVDYSMT